MISNKEFMQEVAIKEDFDIYSFCAELVNWQETLIDFDMEDAITYENIETIKSMILG